MKETHTKSPMCISASTKALRRKTLVKSTVTLVKSVHFYLGENTCQMSPDQEIFRLVVLNQGDEKPPSYMGELQWPQSAIVKIPINQLSITECHKGFVSTVQIWSNYIQSHRIHWMIVHCYRHIGPVKIHHSCTYHSHQSDVLIIMICLYLGVGWQTHQSAVYKCCSMSFEVYKLPMVGCFLCGFQWFGLKSLLIWGGFPHFWLIFFRWMGKNHQLVYCLL